MKTKIRTTSELNSLKDRIHQKDLALKQELKQKWHDLKADLLMSDLSPDRKTERASKKNKTHFLFNKALSIGVSLILSMLADRLLGRFQKR